jgi:hypothetical protein
VSGAPGGDKDEACAQAGGAKISDPLQPLAISFSLIEVIEGEGFLTIKFCTVQQPLRQRWR